MKKKTFTEEELNQFSKPLLVKMLMNALLSLDEMNGRLQDLTDQINTLNQQLYGRKSEKGLTGKKQEEEASPYHQIEMCFNEAEATIEDLDETTLEEMEPTVPDVNPTTKPLPETEQPKKRKPRQKEKILEDIKPFEIREVSHERTGEGLTCGCGGTFEELEGCDDIYHKLQFVPAGFYVEEHHIKKYKCPDCGKIVSAGHPEELLEHSLLTPSLAAGIWTAKYVNAMPFNRLEQNFKCNDARITRQSMSRWMIVIAERYITPLYERLKKELLEFHIIHADETTTLVSKDGRPAGTKSYMWVYTKESLERPVVIYEYQKDRRHVHAKEFLADYQGYLCCDGYEAYHSLGKGITVCGCWSHTRRHYSNAVKALETNGERKAELDISEEALRRIGEFFELERSWKELPYEEHLKLRQTVLKKKMDDYFKWVRIQKAKGIVRPKSETGKGLQYSINQEKYLVGLLGDPNVPLDNSMAERSIRAYVVSRKNFVLIDTVAGAEASAMLFSIAETVKANKLKPYDYFKYMLEQMLQHQNDKDLDFLEDLLPWNEKLQATMRKPNI